MRSSIKINESRHPSPGNSGRRKLWLISLLGLLGVIVIWSLNLVVTFEPSVKDLPDYSVLTKAPPNWKEYSQVPEAIKELKTGWYLSQTSPSIKWDVEFERKISRESLNVQTAQMEQIFAEEEAFRKSEMNKALERYSGKLYQEIEREIAVKTTGLENTYKEEVGRQELDIKTAIEKYHEEMVAEYQVTLTNLQLQLLLADIPNNVKDAASEKQKIQNRIEKVHQEMYDKVTVRQRQLTAGLEEFKKRRRMVLNSELVNLKTQLATSVENELNRYRQSLENDFIQWRQQRQQEIQMGIELRAD